MTSSRAGQSMSFPLGAPLFRLHGRVHFEFVDGTLYGFATALDGPAEVYEEGVVIVMNAGIALIPWRAIRNLRGWSSPHAAAAREVAITGIAGAAAGTLTALSAPNYGVN